jgi:hypothetical protein
MNSLRTTATLLSIWLALSPVSLALAQDPVTGAFEGHVKNLQTGAPIAGAAVQFINQSTEVPVARKSDAEGYFYQGLLQPGVYTIRARAQGFKPYEATQPLYATRNNRVIPIPIEMEPETAVVAVAPPPVPADDALPAEPPAELTSTDGRRAGAFSDVELTRLPLGGVTLTRSFDELALLVPGVALAPQSIGNGGNSNGPGVGAGVGTSGQFAVNGLRSRGNNFLVDGSDNNDEDIGVRRQGFFALVPQSLESVKEFQIITALAPAAFGRNLGATVNAISKSGGNAWHGSAQGFLNTSHLNARNFFDYEGANRSFALRSERDQAVLDCTGVSAEGSFINNSVVSQSRNVSPNFLTLNTGGWVSDFTRGDFFGSPVALGIFSYFNPAVGGISTNGVFTPTVQPGTLNTRNANLTNDLLLKIFADNFLFPNPLSATLPTRAFPTPLSHQYSLAFEQQLSRTSFLTLAYVGTQGKNLIRLSTPNQGPNNIVVPLAVGVRPLTHEQLLSPFFVGFSGSPGQGRRPTAGFGAITMFEAASRSSYHAIQMQLRGQWKRLQGQVNYTWSQTLDDASDVFDLAGAPALPQNSLTRAGEYAASNFDARHRVSYHASFRLPSLRLSPSKLKQTLLGGYELLATGQYQTGQPFTVNTSYDENLDGNLTDRLYTTEGLVIQRNDRQHPLKVTVANRNDLLSVLDDGQVARNYFRASSYLLLNLALQKSLTLSESKQLQFRAEAFNFLNRANFALPVRILEAPSFGSSVATATPARRIQFALKYVF